ncbi:uncharacterized protein LOC129551189 [Moschus berezovskii]|uniref:uncharacterized protein LOC129551189 n=1 Tax=Moschus berezovskii TaxID=68408 RepID=UPI0024449D84|nr:uncharacterized protein LOC129551189 [Moschus berezovskii]
MFPMEWKVALCKTLYWHAPLRHARVHTAVLAHTHTHPASQLMQQQESDWPGRLERSLELLPAAAWPQASPASLWACAAVRGGARSPPGVSLQAGWMSRCLCRPSPPPPATAKGSSSQDTAPCLPPGSTGSLKNISQCTALNHSHMLALSGSLQNARAWVPHWKLWFRYCGDSVGRWTRSRVQESLFLSPPCLRQRPSVGNHPIARAHTHTHTDGIQRGSSWGQYSLWNPPRGEPCPAPPPVPALPLAQPSGSVVAAHRSSEGEAGSGRAGLSTPRPALGSHVRWRGTGETGLWRPRLLWCLFLQVSRPTRLPPDSS